jgi:hypothetical protein
VFVILRLRTLSTLKTSENSLFAYAYVEIYTQARMCFALVSATMPCLHAYFQDAETGLLGGGLTATNSSYTGSGRDVKYEPSTNSKVPDSMRDAHELSGFTNAETITSAAASSDTSSVTSSRSERAIVVKQTVNVQYV